MSIGNASSISSTTAIFQMTGRQFKEESGRLDYFLKKQFCTSKVGDLEQYIRSDSITLPPYYSTIDAQKNWMIDEILTATTAKDRARAIKRMIKLAQYLYKKGNYSGYLMTISALNETSISRLKMSWLQVPKKYTSWLFEQFEICLSGNYANLLKIMAQQQSSYFPYLFAIKKDYQRAKYDYEVKAEELIDCPPELHEQTKHDMEVLATQMEAILITLTSIHNQLSHSLFISKKETSSSFVTRVKSWQMQDQDRLETSFWNRSVLLE